MGFSSFAKGYLPYVPRKRACYGFCEGPDLNFAYARCVEHPITNNNDQERFGILLDPSPPDFWILMIDAKSETELQRQLVKPPYFYDDPIQEKEDCMSGRIYGWLITLLYENLFLLKLPRSHTLGFLQHLSADQGIGWKLVNLRGAILEKIGHHQARALGGEQVMFDSFQGPSKPIIL